MADILKVGKYKFKSRLIIGTGKYKNFKETAKAVKASGADGNCCSETGKY